MKTKLIAVLALLSILIVNPFLVKADMICGTWAKNDTKFNQILSPSDITANRTDLVFKCIGGGDHLGATSYLIGITTLIIVVIIIYKLVEYLWPEKKDDKHEKRK